MKKIYLLMVAMVWSLAAHAYLPLVREGAKFYYYEWWGEYFYEGQDDKNVRLKCFEIMGDTVINDISYKKMYLTCNDMNLTWKRKRMALDQDYEEYDFSRKWNQKDPILFVREENKKVYARANKREENKDVNYWWNGYQEEVIYDFENVERDFAFSDTAMIEGEECKVYHNVNSWLGLYLIEGIGYVDGYVNSGCYDLLGGYDLSNSEDTFICMSHVENAAGEVVYEGSLYQKYNVKQPMLGDTNDDDRIDVEDVNESINMVLRGDRIPFMRRVDMNGDGKVDVEDVNALINIILKVE